MHHGFDRQLFKGRTVVVTGAGSGIGASVARAFSACGAYVIAHVGRTPRSEVGLGRHRELLYADFTRADQTRSFIEEVLQLAPVIDVLVNNAGTMIGRFPVASLTDDQYRDIVELNQSAVVRICGGLLGALRASPAPSIVNTVSISARTGGSAGSAIYSATKAFVVTYSRALARELGPDGIRVNAVSPGTIETDFHRRYSTPEKLAATRASIPLGRLGTPDDCAPAFLFLAAHSLSGYITGQVLEINGGQLMA